jgi:hypothetical protein
MVMSMVHSDGLSVWPKMDECKAQFIECLLLQNGFNNEMNAARSELYSNSCMIVSASFRQTVDVIVNLLNREVFYLCDAVYWIGSGQEQEEARVLSGQSKVC